MLTVPITIPVTAAYSLVFLSAYFKCVSCLVHKSRVVFRHIAVSSAQEPLFLLDPQDLQLQPFLYETRYSCLPPLSCSTVLLCFKLRCCCQERGDDIDGSGEDPTVCTSVITSCISLVFYYLAKICSVDILQICEFFILHVPVLYFRSPDVAKKKYV